MSNCNCRDCQARKMTHIDVSLMNDGSVQVRVYLGWERGQPYYYDHEIIVAGDGDRGPGWISDWVADRFMTERLEAFGVIDAIEAQLKGNEPDDYPVDEDAWKEQVSL